MTTLLKYAALVMVIAVLLTRALNVDDFWELNRARSPRIDAFLILVFAASIATLLRYFMPPVIK